MNYRVTCPRLHLLDLNPDSTADTLSHGCFYNSFSYKMAWGATLTIISSVSPHQDKVGGGAGGGGGGGGGIRALGREGSEK